MGFLDKILGHNTEPTTDEKELISLIEQIRTFPCGEMILDKIALIDLTKGKLTLGTQIKVSKPGKVSTATTFDLSNLEETIERYFSISINNRRIIVDGRKIDLDTLRDESYSQAFDVESNIECSRSVDIQEKNQTLVRTSAYRDDHDIQKVRYFRLHGPHHLNTVVDISFSPADISSLDALFSDIDDEKLFLWSERKNPWHNVSEKILASSHKAGCGKFIRQARGYAEHDLETILRFESEHAHLTEALKEANSPVSPPSPRFDKFGNSIVKSPEEDLLLPPSSNGRGQNSPGPEEPNYYEFE